MIKDYKLIQADGNMALAAEVGKFIKLGWVPKGSPILLGEYDGVGDVCPPGYNIAQAIILREPELAELKRLRDLERHVDRIVTELDNPCTDELGMVTFAHEELEKGLNDGPYDRRKVK